MAVATATFTVNNYPSGSDNTQRRQTLYGAVTFAGASPSYVLGGVRCNFTPLSNVQAQTMLPQWVDVRSASGAGVAAGANYQYLWNPQGAPITNLALTSNVVTITAHNNLAAGDVVTLAGLQTTAALNGTVLTVLAGSLTATAFTANLTHGNISSAAETGFCRVNSYASGLPFQGNLMIFTGAAAQSPLAEFATGALPAGIVGSTTVNADQIVFKAEFLKQL
jgi:hypothetical protein